MNFDWQTEQEQEDVWQQEEETETVGDRSPRRRRWLVLLAVVALLLVAGWMVRREAQQRVDEATAAVEEEVVSSHTLGLQAAEAGDDELFVTLLSGREPSWTETQKALLEAGLLYDRAALPFGLRPAGDPEVVDVSFSPDLRAAELQMSQRYTTDLGAGEDTVTLQHTVVYREGQQRWLLAPPEAEFWGSWGSVTDRSLTVDYPMRDEEIARRLAGDLTAILAEMCETLGDLECTPGWWMRLRLEKNPDSLLALSETEAGAPTGTNVSLPSPTLVGLPVDDAAYQVLLRGYARHLVAAAIGDLVGWECCGEGVLFYQALLHEQLAQLELRPRPAPQNDYVYLIDEGVGDSALLDVANGYWHESQPAPPGKEVPLIVHAFLSFLFDEDLARATVAMQRSLSRTDAPSLLLWIEPTAPSMAVLRRRMRTGFRAFVGQQLQRASENAEMPTGLSLPRQDLLLACGGGSDGFDLYRYDLTTGNLSLEVVLNGGFVQMVGGAPHGTVAVLALDEGSDEIVIENVLWRPSGETVEAFGPDAPGQGQVWLPLDYGPGGELTALIYTMPVEESEPFVGLVDVESCEPGGCDVQPLPGLPLWSPSGDHALALDIFQEEILLHLRAEDGETWQEVGRAWTPLWLDDETYAYVPYINQLRSGSLWAAPVNGGEPQRLVPVEDLMAELPLELSGRRPIISWAFVDSRDENRMFVGARDQSGGGQLLFAVERATGETSWLEASLTVKFIENLAETLSVEWFGGWYGVHDIVSPDGRWLLLPLGESESGDAGLLLYDVLNQEIALRSKSGTITGGLLNHSYSWSRGSEWLARPVAGMIDVLAPGYQVNGRPYRRLIVHDFEGCTQALWVDDG